MTRPGTESGSHLPFGPYRGRGVDEVAVMDPGYLIEILGEAVGPAELRAEAARALASRGRLSRDLEGVASHSLPRRRSCFWRGPVSGSRPAVLVGAILGLALLIGLTALPDRIQLADSPGPQGAKERLNITSLPSTAAVTGGDVGGSAGQAEPPQSIDASAPCGARVPGAIPAASAADFLDTFQAVEFEVLRSKDTGRVTFLNSHDPYEGHFYVAIFPDDYPHFPSPPAQHFRGRCVVVQGSIESYRGTAQIVLRDPEDIRIVEGADDSSVEPGPAAP